MKLLPIFYSKSQFNIINKTDKNSLAATNPMVNYATLSPLTVDTVSFGRTAENAEALRELMKYGIPDLYTGKNVLDPKWLETLYARHFFAKPIKQIVKVLKPYEASLQKTERVFFGIVKGFTKSRPEYKLEDVIHAIAPKYNNILINQQTPIFDELFELSLYLPETYQKKFNALMKVVSKKMNYEPVLIPFNVKEFRYKLQRIAENDSAKKNETENIILRNMLQLSKKMLDLEKNHFNKCNMTNMKHSKKNKYEKNLIRKRADILTQIEMLRTGTSLNSNKELTLLFSRARSQIYNIPLQIPFNRKTFIIDLKEILKTLEDKKLAGLMIRTARKLPTSHDSLAAFIMKCQDYSSEEIGFAMTNSSGGNVDHLKPYSKNGKDSLENYAITTNYHNSERGERLMEEQLAKYPKIYQYAQKQVDRYIELYNSGIFKKVGLSKYYILNFAKTLYDLSPENKRLVLNLDKLNEN